MDTRPPTAAVAAPSTVGLPWCSHSITTQVTTAVLVAVLVVRKARAAVPSAASSLPALKPNQPTQRSAVPITTRGRLWGGIGTLPCPARGPRKMAAARAEKPLDMWTTRPPAKSSAPHSLIMPPPQTMWASGQ